MFSSEEYIFNAITGPLSSEFGNNCSMLLMSKSLNKIFLLRHLYDITI